MIYWAIATSTKYPDVYVKRIEADTDEAAVEQAKVWHRERIGFRYTYVVTKEIAKDLERLGAGNECGECGSDLSGGFHGDGCSFNGFYKPWPKINIL